MYLFRLLTIYLALNDRKYAQSKSEHEQSLQEKTLSSSDIVSSVSHLG